MEKNREENFYFGKGRTHEQLGPMNTRTAGEQELPEEIKRAIDNQTLRQYTATKDKKNKVGR